MRAIARGFAADWIRLADVPARAAREMGTVDVHDTEAGNLALGGGWMDI